MLKIKIKNKRKYAFDIVPLIEVNSETITKIIYCNETDA